MASSVSLSSESSTTFSVGTNTNSVSSDANGVNGNISLQLLCQGIPQFVKIDGKRILENVMTTLGASNVPVYSLVPCGSDGVKFSIKLEVSKLPTLNGNQSHFSVVEGEPSQNPIDAEESAIMYAFKYLERNHCVRVEDFSSLVSKELDSYNTYDIICEAFDHVNNILVQWDLGMHTFLEFAGRIESEDLSFDPSLSVSTNGKVFGPLSDYFTSVHIRLHAKTKDIREGLEELELERLHYKRKFDQEWKVFARTGPFLNPVYPSKLLLESVLKYYGLDSAEYSNSPEATGMVKSTVCFKFPYMEKFKYGGNLAISAQGFCYADADEKAAYQALVFIEKNFLTKVVDVNYNKRKKVVKTQKKLLCILSRILKFGDSLKMMFGEMINAIEFKRQQFSFDPSSFFSTPSAAGQIEAYLYCSNVLKEFDGAAVRCYRACAPHFEFLNTVSWKIILMLNSVTLN